MSDEATKRRSDEGKGGDAAFSPSPGTPGEGRGEGPSSPSNPLPSPSSLRRSVASSLLLSSLLILASCDSDAGRGGTGEMVVPRETLRRIDGTDMAALSTTRPTSRPAPTSHPAAPATMKLSIAEVRRAALRNNLELAVELISPSIAQENLSEAEAQFESLFVASTDYAKTDTPTASQLVGSQSESLRGSAGVRVPLRTGGTLDFNLPVDRLKTNNQFSTLNPAYTSDFAASLSHPLLRGAGTFVNTQRIRIAFYQQQQTEARTKLEVIRVLANAERIYWRLYAARRELEVRQKEYELAEAQLERAQRQVQAGAAADVEVVRAESGLADRLEGIIIAENALRDRQRELKRMLNDPDLPMRERTIILPETHPRPLFYKLDPDRLVQAALDQRMEMLETELQIATETANVRVARNGLLPLVNATYDYSINGLGPSLSDSLEMTSNKDFEDHRLGVRMEIPIGNQAAHSRLRSALLSRMQQLGTKASRAAQIELEVRDAIDQLEANFQRILAAQKRVVLAARVLDLEIRQFNLGLRTTDDVLEAQASLGAAQLSEISALTEYQIAQIDIAFATGTLLGASQVAWEPGR